MSSPLINTRHIHPWLPGAYFRWRSWTLAAPFSFRRPRTKRAGTIEPNLQLQSMGVPDTRREGPVGRGLA